MIGGAGGSGSSGNAVAADHGALLLLAWYE